MEKQDKASAQNEANRGQGPGRTANTGKDDKKQQEDISNVDRQEGDMNNGELGGNMGQKQDDQ